MMRLLQLLFGRWRETRGDVQTRITRWTMGPELERELFQGDAQDFAHKRSLRTGECDPMGRPLARQWEEYYRELREGALI